MDKKQNLFQSPALITKVESQHDGGIRVVVDTQEITDPEQLAMLFHLKGDLGWFLFKKTEVVLEDIPDYDPQQFDEEKTPSKRLRNVLFIYWKEVLGQKGNFESFYRGWMDKKIEAVKGELPAQNY